MIGNTNITFYNKVEYDKKYINNEYKIKVIDYDGSIIDQQNLNSGQEYTLPTPPTHSGLTFQEWSSSKAITNNKILVDNDNVIIGAVYTTTSGLNEFDIELTESTGLTVNFRMVGNKDWGDNTSDTEISHTYSNYGKYTIKCDGTEVITDYYVGMFNQKYDNINYYVKNIRLSNRMTKIESRNFSYCFSLRTLTISNNMINRISIGDNYSLETVIIPNSAINGCSLYKCYSLKNVVIPNTVNSLAPFDSCGVLNNVIIPNNVTTLANYFFRYCDAITDITIPDSVTSIGTEAFFDCFALKNIKLSNNITSIKSNTFYNCYSLKNIILPNNLTSIEGNAFQNCYSIQEYDFSNSVSVPTLSSIGAFNGINKTCKIKVPFDLYSDWVVATNWSSYESYIVSDGTTTVNFTGDNTHDIYVNGSLISSTSITWYSSKLPYYVYDSTNNILLPTQIATGLIKNNVQNINIDLSIKKKITLQIGTTGLDVTFTIEGKTYNSTSDNNGNYYIYIIGSGTTIDYYVNGGVAYEDITGSILTTGSDITEVITLSPATWSTWTRPNLDSTTKNGTLGGDSFAVSAVAWSTAVYPTWQAVDNDNSTYWMSEIKSSVDYIFYYPSLLKVTKIKFIYYSEASNVIIQGSNDNTNWNNISSTYSTSTQTLTVTLTNNECYKYYKLIFTVSSAYIGVFDMQITATVKN